MTNILPYEMTKELSAAIEKHGNDLRVCLFFWHTTTMVRDVQAIMIEPKVDYLESIKSYMIGADFPNDAVIDAYVVYMSADNFEAWKGCTRDLIKTFPYPYDFDRKRFQELVGQAGDCMGVWCGL